MIYFDTSFLVPLILSEPSSKRVERVVHRQPAGELAVSHWTRVEFSSLLAREVRMGGMDGLAARRADAEFEAVVAESFRVLLPDEEDFNLSKQYLQRYESGLRAADALHLAIAKNQKAAMIYSLDRKLLRAGRVLGLPIASDTTIGRS